MTDRIKSILRDYANDIINIYGDHLKAVILYGSYARGDFNEDSDIDIMILVDLDDMEIKEYRNQLSDVTFNYNYDNDILIMPIVKNLAHFCHWVNAYPFYNNIYKEGVSLYVV